MAMAVKNNLRIFARMGYLNFRFRVMVEVVAAAVKTNLALQT